MTISAGLRSQTDVVSAEDAGDDIPAGVRANSVKRVAAAVGEGSIAVRLVQHYLGQTG